MNRTFIHGLATALLLAAGLVAPASAGTSRAWVVAITGKAADIPDRGEIRQLRIGDSVREGDNLQLETEKSRLVLRTGDGTLLAFRGRTRVRFTQFNNDGKDGTQLTRLTLEWGNFWAKVTKLATGRSKFEVKAGGIVCGVRGTTLGGTYDGDTDHGQFYNFEGHVTVDDGSGTKDVPQGGHWDFSDGALGSSSANTPGIGEHLGAPGPNEDLSGNGAPPSLGDQAPGTAEQVLEAMGGPATDPSERFFVEPGRLGVILGLGIPEGGR